MAQTYDQLVASVRDWSNRDSEQLTDTIIQQSLRFAADTAYRDLMIPPLENTAQYLMLANNNTRDASLDNIGNVFQSILNSPSGSNRTNQARAELSIPSDLTTFIHLRVLGRAQRNDDGTVTREDNTDTSSPILLTTNSDPNAVVFNQKADVRTFHDMNADKYTANYWTRQQDNILVNGFISEDSVIELYYYRRLAELDERYTITGITDASDPRLEEAPAGNTFPTVTINSTVYRGRLTPNWLREENDKVLLFGALYHCFDYLADDVMAQKYLQKFNDSIMELNEEDRRRRASGGNVQVNFNGNGLI